MSVAIWNRILITTLATGNKNPAEWIEAPAHPLLRRYMEQLAGLPVELRLSYREIQTIIDDKELDPFWRSLIHCGQAMKRHRTPKDRLQSFIRALAVITALKDGDPGWRYINCLHYLGRWTIPGDALLHAKDTRAAAAERMISEGWRLPPSWPYIERPQPQQEAEPIRQAG